MKEGVPQRVFIIAEAGVNHNGSLALAKRLVDTAAAAGADAVKFQTFVAERLVSRTAPQADYQKRNTGKAESQFAMIRRLELDEVAHRALIAHCRKRGIAFLSTPFDLESIDLLDRLGLDTFKIGSGEITNLPYLRKIGALGKKIILSTGMSTLPEVAAAVRALVKAGTPKKNITLLHCTTEYPAPYEEVNLRAMLTLRKKTGLAVGYSDHTRGLGVSVAAVALGASVIEKHFTLSRKMKGPDHQASLEPRELGALVAAIRNVEKALGDGVKVPSPAERKNIAVARKSIVAAHAIRKGEPFTEVNLAAKRPGIGISPMLWDRVLGRRASRDFAEDELITISGKERKRT